MPGAAAPVSGATPVAQPTPRGNGGESAPILVAGSAAAAAVVVAACVSPILAAAVLVIYVFWSLRLYPRKTIEVGWADLGSALFSALVLPGGLLRQERHGEREELNEAIEKIWTGGLRCARGAPPSGGAIVSLAARTIVDIALTKLQLPRGSEAIFFPGVTIPALVEIMEGHGVRSIGLDVPFGKDARAPDLEPFINERTKVLVVTHLFGCARDVEALIREGRRLGLFVIEDCAQAFVGGPAAAGSLVGGFRGHAEADLAIVSFGFMKTLTALNGAVGYVRDATLLEGMLQIESEYQKRRPSVCFMRVVKAGLIKLIGGPCMWGFAAALVNACGLDWDQLIVGSVRGFSDKTAHRQRPSIPQIRLLLRRLRDQRPAYATGAGRRGAQLATRRALCEDLLARLAAQGAEVLGHGGSRIISDAWWLAPILDDDPKGLVSFLWARGFDATCSTTQLKPIGHAAAPAPGSPHDLMGRVVYLPMTEQLSRKAVARLAEAICEWRRERCPGRSSSEERLRARSLLGLVVLAAAFCFGATDGVLRFLPSASVVFRAWLAAALLFALCALLGRRLAAEPHLLADRELLDAMRPQPRVEGAEFWRSVPVPKDGRIDGAVLLTGVTGFVGGGLLFGLLSRARDLGISKIAVLVRRKSGSPAEARLKELRANPAFQEVMEAFDQLVVAVEGDVAQQDFGWPAGLGSWPHSEPLMAVLHCAGDVRFDQPLQQAALSIITASLQVAQLAAKWRAKRFVFVSTAFVHGVPSATSVLPERLVELRDFDAMELYRDAISHGSWAEKAMRELGFPNTYTFTKAIAEHLILKSCAAEGLQAHIVRPSIVGPAWAAPFPGWAGDKPSTIVAGAVLLARRGVRVFRGSKHPCPAVPVDLVAVSIMEAMAGTGGTPDDAHVALGSGIRHATVDASQAEWIPSFQTMMHRLFQVLALRGDLSLVEAGLLCKLLHWSANETAFRLIDFIANVLPNYAAAVFSSIGFLVARVLGLGTETWRARCTMTDLLCSYSRLPVLYAPFSSPSSAWKFQSTLRLPSDWDPVQYTLLMHRAAVDFARNPAVAPPRLPAREAADAFCELRVVAPCGFLYDALMTFSMPGAPLPHCAAALMVHRVLQWMDLRVTVDAGSLVALSNLSAPLVFCPTHRSLLDFVIIGATCFQLRPQLPILQLPSVAADAEFSSLPVLGRVLSSLGAFFIRRGGGAVQPDPALRAEVGRVFRRGKPLEVFLEGLRSRGRRHMRLRTGLLRALRDVAQCRVALVPMALSYELLPEDESFFGELKGLPRPPLTTGGFINWVLRGFLGDLPSYGDARIRLGSEKVMDASSDLRSLLSEVQAELVDLTVLTSLHTRALAELLELPPDAVLHAWRAAGLPLRPSRLEAPHVVLSEAQRWPLALQAATQLRERLPQDWARWLVEPVVGGHGTVAATEPIDGSCEVAATGGDGPLDIKAVAAALSARLAAAEAFAVKAVERLRDSGVAEVTEEHLLQQLLRETQDGGGLAPPLARGAASIVAGARSKPSAAAGYDAPPAPSGEEGANRQPVLPLWPAPHAAAEVAARRRRGVGIGRPAASSVSPPLVVDDREALDRWGFRDTRFAADWVDGRPAVQVTSRRYGSLGTQPLFQLWSFFQKQLGVSMNVRDTLPDLPLPEVPETPAALKAALEKAVPKERLATDAESRWRAGTGHGLADIWRLRTREAGCRMPDAVVRPESEAEVAAILQAAASDELGFAVVPVGGRTNVTSATMVPSMEEDARPFVAMDMRGMASVLWVNAEDGVAHIEAGITGMALKEALAQHGVTMGMEPDSMEFSTLGGWIATRASGMKRSRYGNIEDMIIEARVVTPAGVLWQRNGGAVSSASSRTAFGRVSANVQLPSLILGSEGCLGIVTSAVVRVKPLPEVIEHQSAIFPDWSTGAAFMREVARLPAAARPTSCRLMDSKQLALSRAIREGNGGHGVLKTALQTLALRLKGVSLDDAAAVTLLFEGTREEVALQQRLLAPLVSRFGGMWGGAAAGEAGYALTFAIAYLRDFGLDYRILSESLETMAPWSAVGQVWPAVVAAVRAEHKALQLPGQPFLSCRMTQLYDEGAVLYMYMAVSTAGLAQERCLEAFERLEHAARRAALAAGGCLSHHHGVGKLRAPLLRESQSAELTAVLQGLKASMDPWNVLAARNGAWSTAAVSSAASASETLSEASAWSTPAAPFTASAHAEASLNSTIDEFTGEAVTSLTEFAGSTEEQFQEAADYVKTFQPSRAIPNDRKLKLYGYFKQINEGDVTGSRPGMLSFEARAKWDAWNETKGMDQKAAMAAYVQELQAQVEEFK